MQGICRLSRLQKSLAATAFCKSERLWQLLPLSVSRNPQRAAAKLFQRVDRIVFTCELRLKVLTALVVTDLELQGIGSDRLGVENQPLAEVLAVAKIPHHLAHEILTGDCHVLIHSVDDYVDAELFIIYGAREQALALSKCMQAAEEKKCCQSC